MESTIYKPSIYNGAGIYKTGAEGGGGGGGNDYFAQPIGLYNNIGIFSEEDKIKIYWDAIYKGLGGLGYVTNLTPNGFNKIEMKITKYLAQGGGDIQVISYRATNANYDDGRLFSLEHDPNSGTLSFKVAQNSGSWMVVYSGNYPIDNEYEYYVEITKQESLYNFKLYVNGNLVYNNNHMLYNGGLWSPQICLSYYYGNRTPGYANLRPNEYIVMSKSYLYIDDERFFGFK